MDKSNQTDSEQVTDFFDASGTSLPGKVKVKMP